MRPLHKVRVFARVLRAEGVRAVRERLSDRWADWALRSSVSSTRVDLASPSPISARSSLRVSPAVLLYLATPPKPSLGGVQASLRAWLNEAARHRRVALLYRSSRDLYHLSVTGGVGSHRVDLAVPEGVDGPSLTDPGFESALRWSLEATGAELLHLVGLHGVPLESLERCVPGGLATLISLHDFSPFCFRSHLLEEPGLRFCGYCRDLDRCGRCLGWSLPLSGEDQGRRREAAARLLGGADGLTFASRFLRRAYRELFPGTDEVRSWIVPPLSVASNLTVDEVARARTVEGSGDHPMRHLAFVGSALPHKGILVFERLLDEVRGTALEGLRWSVFGGGDTAVLRRLRGRPRVRVRGYYRAGTLPRLLVREHVDLALLLSIVPEAYGLTLGECRLAGVPVVAFDQGALGERLAEEGGGLTVPLSSGARGLAQTLEAVRSGRRVPPAARATAGSSPAEHEHAWQAIYAESLAASDCGRVPSPVPASRSLSIVIPSRDTVRLTLACLDSIPPNGDPRVEVIVVDDASADGTPEAIEERYPAVRVLRQTVAQGFGASANRGLKMARGAVLLALNSDTELAPGSLSALVDRFAASERLGVAGGRLSYPDGTPQWSGGRTPGLLWLFGVASGLPALAAHLPGWRRIRPAAGTGRSTGVEWVTGAALAIRREVWEAVGPFDASYRFYGQDLDLCFRARAAGWEVEVVPGFRVVHHHGATLAPRGRRGPFHDPVLLWSDLVHWARRHRGESWARWAARSLRLGGRLRLWGRGLWALALPAGSRAAWRRDTLAYRQAIRAVSRRSATEPDAQP